MPRPTTSRFFHSVALVSASATLATAQVTIQSTFNPTQTGSTCALAGEADVWLYGCNASTFEHYAADGTFLASIPRSGGAGNDVDLDLAPEDLFLGGTLVPAGSLLHFDGESGVCEVYAIDPSSGAVLASLVTAYGNSHVVGGAYDPNSDTLLLVQDRNGGAQANEIARIDPDTGAVISTFSTIAAGFSVNFGDIDFAASSNAIYLVSSAEPDIGVFDTAGVLLGRIPLPASVGALSGIGIEDASGGAWVCGTSGNVWRLAGIVEIGVPYCGPAVANSTGVGALARAFGSDVRADDQVILYAFQLPNQSFGYFLTSRTTGLVANPGGAQGNLCLGGDIGRYSAPGQIFNSASIGRAELALDLAQTPTPALGLVSIQAGETWNFQAWYRDANPTTTSNFTDAVAILFR